MAGRAAVGAALVFALSALVVAPAQAQSLAISSSITLPGDVLGSGQFASVDTVNDPQLYTNLDPILGSYTNLNPGGTFEAGTYIPGSGNFNFSSAVTNNQLPTSIGVISVSLSLYGLDTAAGNFDFNDIDVYKRQTRTNLAPGAAALAIPRRSRKRASAAHSQRHDSNPRHFPSRG